MNSNKNFLSWAFVLSLACLGFGRLRLAIRRAVAGQTYSAKSDPGKIGCTAVSLETLCSRSVKTAEGVRSNGAFHLEWLRGRVSTRWSVC
jgi:hypothetical protein